MARQDELNRAENTLSDALNGMDEALKTLRVLAENDTMDHVFELAASALVEDRGLIEDAISSVVDGFGIGDDDD